MSCPPISLSPREVPKMIYAARVPKEALVALEDVEPTWVFLLGGNCGDVLGAAKALGEKGIVVFVHIDMCHGINNDADGLALLAALGQPAGIITTHPSAVGAAKKLGLLTVERIFLLDSASVESGLKNVARAAPDIVEVLPGVLPEHITRVASALDTLLIAGGLITKMSQVEDALKAGALGVSTSSRRLMEEAHKFL